MLASVANALATPTLCCWPPLSSAGYLFIYSSELSPTIFNNSIVFLFIFSNGSFFNLGINSIFSFIVMCGNNPTFWITYPICLLNWIVSSLAIKFPFMNIDPSVGFINLLIIFNVVVLPQPLGPINTTKSPSLIWRFISFNITLSPICLVIPLNSIIFPLLLTTYF